MEPQEYLVFARLQPSWGPHYEESKITQGWGEMGLFLPLGKEMC